MTLTPLSGGLLAISVFIAATIAWNLTRTKRRIAGSSGPKRFPRPSNRPIRPPARAQARAAKPGFKAVAIWGTAAALIAWVALSLANPAKAPESPAQAQEGTGTLEPPPARASLPSYSGTLSPPPPPGSLTPPAPEPAPEAPPAPFAPPNPLRAAGQPNIKTAALSISNPAPEPAGPLSTFAPEDQAFVPSADGAIGESATAMAPGVSRMELLGRTLLPPKEAKRAKVLAPTPERPRLVPQEPAPAAPQATRPSPAESRPAQPIPIPPPQEPSALPASRATQTPVAPDPPAEPRPRPAASPPPLSDPYATGSVTYTVLLGSFGKAENAERLRLRMIEAGLPVSVAAVTAQDNKVWYRVMSGNFDTQSEADSYGRELKQKNLTDQTFIFKNSGQ
ncbi:MAG: SPOR domain-containing protein [Deltaproteobacteria bacterium]|jgi:cell division protein FtsN|nr:SPOR domain-containing protein [Deltaproteobacteria bacterium]